ncbi:mycofactocin-coupled SDR family oxidoreductase [Microbacterium aquimaris]|uniref:mycofactocin-coupled SDR family oxidoreductase n=1 Tax=Microbacterium aquimaris TaxID=459816 RepID=UPI002AD32821|nr:mycofactocin-coupled SDR family oxidoreductase [Microbacterium aquimaris]MDZ8276696.1 mycofactocin-coupled SDR family oxidoreductase [Microbacterium aquimaris]
MAGRVEGKVALITGAARGQGRSHAVRLAEEGADIIAVDLCGPVPNLQYSHATEDDLAETVRQVEALDRRIVATKTDVRDRDAFKTAIDDGVAQLGKLDIVVGNAGICIIAPWDEVTPEIWNDTISTNLTGVFNTVQLSAPHLIAAGGGSIILTSSAAGLKGLPFITPYAASKHGVTGLGRAFASELAEHSIRVNTLHPTGVETAMGEMAGAFPPLLEKNPRVGGMLTNMLPIDATEPRDQSNAVLFLASDEARYVTALAMTVDAGNTQY